MNPIDLLPIEHPTEVDPSIDNPLYFYDNVVKPLIPTVINIQNNGIPIDLNKVEKLEKTLVDLLEEVNIKAHNNKYIQQYLTTVHKRTINDKRQELSIKAKGYKDYYKPYDTSKIELRTALVNYYFKSKGKDTYCKDKWTVKDLKSLNTFKVDTFIQDVIDKKIDSRSEIAVEAMVDYAASKATIYNKSLQDKLKEAEKVALQFNLGSAKQKKEFFAMVGIEHLSTTDKGEPSYPRKDLEKILQTITDVDLIEAIQLFIDYSYGAIVKNNFIEAFKRYTIDGILYGKIILHGTKSFRITSKEPKLNWVS
jgi:hypothetical protein